jgi:hypothetical protein
MPDQRTHIRRTDADAVTDADPKPLSFAHSVADTRAMQQ